jgi:hypothetical protein
MSKSKMTDDLDTYAKIDPMDWEIVYIVLAPDASFPSNIRAPKQSRFKFA